MENFVIKVRMLGGLSVSCGETICGFDNRAYKVWLFLAYLICHRDRMISRNELVALLGNGDAYTDPGRTLRNIRMRARRTLQPLADAIGQELVISKGQLCGWNPDVRTELDAEEFQTLCALGEAEEDEKRAAVKKLLAYLERTNGAREAAGLCRSALQIDPYNEDLVETDLFKKLYPSLYDEEGNIIGEVVESFTTPADGVVIIKGLDNVKYTLTELEAPSGYNKLDRPVEVTPSVDSVTTWTIYTDAEGNVTATEPETEEVDSDNLPVLTMLQHIENLTGAELPSTGGIGTTIFYILGGTLMVGARVFFVVKRRMGGDAE